VVAGQWPSGGQAMMAGLRRPGGDGRAPGEAAITARRGGAGGRARDKEAAAVVRAARRRRP
jgi:hypothetical protein